MKVRVLKPFSGQHGGYSADSIVDLPEGADWVKIGYAEEVKDEQPKAQEKNPGPKNVVAPEPVSRDKRGSKAPSVSPHPVVDSKE